MFYLFISAVFLLILTFLGAFASVSGESKEKQVLLASKRQVCVSVCRVLSSGLAWQAT